MDRAMHPAAESGEESPPTGLAPLIVEGAVEIWGMLGPLLGRPNRGDEPRPLVHEKPPRDSKVIGRGRGGRKRSSTLTAKIPVTPIRAPITHSPPISNLESQI